MHMRMRFTNKIELIIVLCSMLSAITCGISNQNMFKCAARMKIWLLKDIFNTYLH